MFMVNYAVPSVYTDRGAQPELDSVLGTYGAIEMAPLDFLQDVWAPGYVQRSANAPGDNRSACPIMLVRCSTVTSVPGEDYTVRQWGYNKVVHWDDERNEYTHIGRALRRRYGEDENDDDRHYFMSGLGYIGKERRKDEAICMYALIFDLDYQNAQTLGNLMHQASNELIPMPTHIALTGTGIHLYYVFDEPITLYHGSFGRKVKTQLNALKHALTEQLWTPYTVGDGHGTAPQYQGINQAFRIVGSYTKAMGINHERYRVRGFKLPRRKLGDLGELYAYVSNNAQIKKVGEYNSGLSVHDREYWAEHSPDWYNRKIVNNDHTPRYWSVDAKVYEWWINKCLDTEKGAKFGHRYNCMLMAVVYAIKCEISRDELIDDIRNKLLPFFVRLKADDPITEADVNEAIQAYDDAFRTFPISSIEFLSGITIKRNKRNGRTRQQQIILARKRLADLNEVDGYTHQGRPDHRQDVLIYRRTHPDATKAQCVRDTGLAKSTVYKWWNVI